METYDYAGSALHCNLEDHLSKEQYLKLIDFAIKNGTNYFTFNIPNSKCECKSFIILLFLHNYHYYNYNDSYNNDCLTLELCLK